MYFFEIYMGQGLPVVRCMEAAIVIGSGSTHAPEMQPTIPGVSCQVTTSEPDRKGYSCS